MTCALDSNCRGTRCGHQDCRSTRCVKPRRGGIFAVLAERPNWVEPAQKEKEHG